MELGALITVGLISQYIVAKISSTNSASIDSRLQNV